MSRMPDDGRDIHEYRVAEDRPAISYGPDPYREGAWCLAATTGEERVELLLNEQAMYQLWTETKGVPWPSQDREGQAKDRLVRQVLHAANNADAEMLRDALAVLGDPDYREREVRTERDREPFADRVADCEDCEVDSREQAIAIMQDVIIGERQPANWWCDEHVDVFEAETREWADDRDLRTDGGQPVEDDEPEAYTALTVMAARDAETQTLVLGRESEATELQAAEEIDGAVAYVRREYDPREVVSLPGAMTAAEVREWLADHRDHRGFADYDWAAHDRRERLEAHIEERQDYRNLVSSAVDRLEQVPVVSYSAGTAIGAIQQDLLDVLQAGTPYTFDRTPDTGEEGEDAR